MSIYIIGLADHIGAPSVPNVKKGDKVKRGQCIAEPEGLGAKVHSSVNGEIVKITDTAIHIEGSVDNANEYVNIEKGETIADTAFEAGIVGAGGAGFPSHIKLQTEIPNGYVIANCVECEPLLSHNLEAIEKDPMTLIKGIQYAMKATQAPTGYIAIKEKHTKAIEILNESLKDIDNIEVKGLKDMYPMGEERAVIHGIFGEWLKPDELPVVADCVVMNGETLENLTRAMEDSKPVIDKDITVAGKLKSGKEPKVFLQVPIGTPMKDMVEKAGGIDGEYGEVIMGGPYTGLAEDLDSTVVKKTSGGAIITIELPIYEGPLGLLVCACGADEDRLRDLADKMKSEVVGVATCQNVVDVNGAAKCLTPGDCPGQVQKIMDLKSKGAERVIIGNCSDCTNTVMGSAPKLNVGVYHQTDHVYRTVDMEVSRRLPVDN